MPARAMVYFELVRRLHPGEDHAHAHLLPLPRTSPWDRPGWLSDMEAPWECWRAPRACASPASPKRPAASHRCRLLDSLVDPLRAGHSPIYCSQEPGPNQRALGRRRQTLCKPKDINSIASIQTFTQSVPGLLSHRDYAHRNSPLRTWAWAWSGSDGRDSISRDHAAVLIAGAEGVQRADGGFAREVEHLGRRNHTEKVPAPPISACRGTHGGAVSSLLLSHRTAGDTPSSPFPGRANHLNIDCSMKLAQLNFLQFGFLALNKH